MLGKFEQKTYGKIFLLNALGENIFISHDETEVFKGKVYGRVLTRSFLVYCIT